MPVKIQISKDGWTKGLQLSIDYEDPKEGRDHGYRLAGPKFNGSSKILLDYTLDERDIREIERYLNLAKDELNKAQANS